MGFRKAPSSHFHFRGSQAGEQGMANHRIVGLLQQVTLGPAARSYHDRPGSQDCSTHPTSRRETQP